MNITFHSIGFNPTTAQVCFAVTVQGKNGQDNFSFSGGILAFIPREVERRNLGGEKVKVRFDLWKTVETYFRGPGQGWHTTNVQSVIRGIREHRILSEKNVNDFNVQRVFRYIASLARPTAAEFLYSALMDAEAVNYTFPQWCREFGYSDDSIKAESVYRACVEIGRKLEKILSPDELAEARAMTENL